jgi:hypothetical protein
MADNVPITAGVGTPIATDEIGGVHYQRVKLDLGADGVSAPVVGTLPVSGTVSVSNFPASQEVTGPLTDTQLRAAPVPTRLNSYNYPISTANSSTAQLAAGATFTGTIESPQDQPSISILLTSDQPITLTLRQFVDSGGTFAAPDIVFFVPANTGFARSLPINGNFLQITARNTGAATTTTFNLNTAFGMLGDADSTGAQPVTEPPLIITGAPAQTAVVNNILTPTSGATALDVSGFRTASIQVTSTGTGGTFIFEQSNDNVNWVALPVFNAALVTGVPVTAAITATASSIIYTFPIRCRFVRLRIATLITGGSIQAHSRIASDPWTPSVQLVTSNVAANLQATVSGTVTSNIGTGTLAAVTSANLGIPSLVADVASAALTTTTTTAAFTPTFGTTYTVSIPVTAVTGTTPTLDIGIEESDDNGTNWFRVYDFTRITATGMFRSPPLTLRGNRVRYVQTVGGATPSFTRAINRLQRSDDAPLRVSFIDRTINPNTLNSATPAYYIEGCADFNFMVRCTAQTTAATLTKQFSNDGVNWHTSGATLTTSVGISHNKIQNEQWKFGRLIVTAAGTGITLGEAMIIGRA